MNFIILAHTLKYITSAPYFWVSMGMVASVSVFVGAIIFDGDIPTASKGIVGVISYVFFLIQVQVTRVNDTISKTLKNGNFDYMFHAATFSIIVVTLFWILGIFIGVATSSTVRVVMRRKKEVKI